ETSCFDDMVTEWAVLILEKREVIPRAMTRIMASDKLPAVLETAIELGWLPELLEAFFRETPEVTLRVARGSHLWNALSTAISNAAWYRSWIRKTPRTSSWSARMMSWTTLAPGPMQTSRMKPIRPRDENDVSVVPGASPVSAATGGGQRSEPNSRQRS